MVKVGSMRLELPARADLEIYEPARATLMARLEWLEPRPIYSTASKAYNKLTPFIHWWRTHPLWSFPGTYMIGLPELDYKIRAGKGSRWGKMVH